MVSGFSERYPAYIRPVSVLKSVIYQYISGYPTSFLCLNRDKEEGKKYVRIKKTLHTNTRILGYVAGRSHFKADIILGYGADRGR
jgi:hypothetical protein